MHILIVGKSFSGIKAYLSSHGHTFTVLQDKAATKFPEKKFRNRVVADFSDTNNLLATAEAINEKRPINGLLATYENYVIHTAHIAKHLNLPGMSTRAAEACTDKEIMRTLFSRAPEKISPSFAVIKSEDEVRKFAKTHSFPLIVKPANLSKSLLVTKSVTLDELLANYRKSVALIEDIYRKYAPSRQPKLLIEEFLEGPIFSVDAFVDTQGEPHVLENVVDYQTGYDIGFDDNFHYSRLLPSRLSKEEVAAIRHTASVGCRALGMTSSPAHIEIIYTKDGPRIVEIGARNGGYRERMHALANEIDITGNALALSLNQPLNLTPKRNDYVGVFELFPKISGIFEGIQNENILRSLSSFNYISTKAKPGQFAGKAGDGYKMCAVVVLVNHDKLTFNKDVEYLNTQVSVITTR